MNAVVLHAYGGPDNLKLEQVPDPTPGDGEVLVRIAATSINPIDFKMRSGAAAARFPVQFPAILGRDLSGIVRSVGPNVTGFAPGDRVISLASATYAELALIQADLLTHLPEGFDPIDAAAIPLVTLTGSQLITRGVKPQPGQTILVSGALGGVGRAAVFTAKKAGATVIAGVRKSQLKAAQSLGADALLPLDDEASLNTLGLLDAIADTVNGETAQKLIAKVKPGGTFATVVGPPANAKLHPTVHVESVVCQPDPPSLRTLAEDILARRLTIPIDRMLPLSEAADGNRAAEKGGIGKILLLP